MPPAHHGLHLDLGEDAVLVRVVQVKAGVNLRLEIENPRDLKTDSDYEAHF